MTIIDLSLPRRLVQNNVINFSMPTKFLIVNLLALNSNNLNDYLYSNGFALLETLKCMNYCKIKSIKDLI